MPTLPRINLWPDSKCAKAFWGQQHVAPYQELLRDTIAYAEPQAGERWLDLGCGSGPLTEAIWNHTRGEVQEIVSTDCASANEKAFAQLSQTLTPRPGERITFRCHNFSEGLRLFDNEEFTHCISGLAITYAESFDAATQTWNTSAYDQLLAEVHRVIRKGGKFVFSVNVPNPSWWRIARGSISNLTNLKQLRRSWRMMKYGRWLKQEAALGRFHYLPAETVTQKLLAAGFTGVEHRMSYRDQAFVFRAWKTW
jgi:ubiquinone/menaquinone biosynthesis C-methylase UbiE